MCFSLQCATSCQVVEAFFVRLSHGCLVVIVQMMKLLQPYPKKLVSSRDKKIMPVAFSYLHNVDPILSNDMLQEFHRIELI